jgi:hypothetical protein
LGGQLHAITASPMGKEPHIHIEEETKWVPILPELFKDEKNLLLLTIIYNVMTVICIEKFFRRHFRHIK